MKTMKLWRNILVMTAAFSLASCSSGDDTDIYVATELSGTWQKVYDEGVADAGMVQYTFHPQSANNGTVDIFTSDWAPPTGQQATPQFIASTPLPMLDICIFRPSPLTPQLHSPWIATSAVSPARR